MLCTQKDRSPLNICKWDSPNISSGYHNVGEWRRKTDPRGFADMAAIHLHVITKYLIHMRKYIQD